MSDRRTPQEPSMADLLNLFKKDIMMTLNCHAIATIQSFDSIKQTCTATINYGRTFSVKNANGTYVDVLKDYPLLTDCPVIILNGGGAGVRFPIKKGDQCLILFNDRDFDNWFTGASTGHVLSNRLHSLSDGVALVGLNPLASPIKNYDMTRATLFNGETEVGVSETKIRIKNQASTLNNLLQQLITAVKGITTTNAVPGSPCAISPASITALSNIATQIGELLE